MASPIRNTLRALTGACLLVITATAGCQSMQVEHRTASMASNLSTLQYAQVVDDLALIADCPDALPHFALADTGHTTIQLTGTGNVGVGWSLLAVAGKLFDETHLTNTTGMLTFQDQSNDEWDVTPALDPIQELVMSGLLHKALGMTVSNAESVVMESLFNPPYPAGFDTKGQMDKMGRFETYLLCHGYPPTLAWSLAGFKPAYVIALHENYQRVAPGWVHIGKVTDVPRDACYVGKHGRTYVWIDKDGISGLTDLAIAMLDVATTDTAAQAGKNAKQPSPNLYSIPLTLPH